MRSNSVIVLNDMDRGRSSRFSWKTLFSVSLIVTLLVTGSCTQQPTAARAPLKLFTDYLDNQIPDLLKRYGVPGASIALVRNGKPVWSGAYGYADLEHHRKMTVDAVFRAESISKSVTAWGVMRLVEQGSIRLDDSIQQYLDDWNFPESEYSIHGVTIRRLLSHSSGMPLGNFGDEFSPEGNLPSLRGTLNQEAEVVREPGSGFLYSNAGFHLLELLVEEVTGRDFAEYMTTEVLGPLEMHDSGFTWNVKWQSKIPTGYDLKGKGVPLYVYPAKASGGLFATVEDIARFVSAGMIGTYYSSHSFLSPQNLFQLYTAQVNHPGIYSVVADSYGLGHFIEILPNQSRAVWHGGQGHGWMTHFHFIPESGDGIVILTNSQRSWPFMAQVLNDWAQWNGFGSVKMGRIIYATAALRLFICAVILISLWDGYCFAKGVHRGSRLFAPFSQVSRTRRLLKAILGLSMIAALAWSVTQPYLIVSSLFPSIAMWAGVSLLVLAVIMTCSALFPCHDS